MVWITLFCLFNYNNKNKTLLSPFIYLGFYVTVNTVQVLWAEETSWSKFCTVNCQPSVSNYQLSHIRSRVWTADVRGGRRVCYHSATLASFISSRDNYYSTTCTHVNLKRKMSGPRWQSGNTLASHLCGRGSIPVMAVSGKAGSCLPLVGSLQYRTLANYMYWFPLPFQLPVVIWPVQC